MRRNNLLIITLCVMIAAPAAGQGFKVESSDSTNVASHITHPYTYRCGHGGFKTKLPAGCGSVHENWSEPDEDADPMTAVVDGLLICLEHFQKWRPMLKSSDDDI